MKLLYGSDSPRWHVHEDLRMHVAGIYVVTPMPRLLRDLVTAIADVASAISSTQRI